MGSQLATPTKIRSEAKKSNSSKSKHSKLSKHPSLAHRNASHGSHGSKSSKSDDCHTAEPHEPCYQAVAGLQDADVLRTELEHDENMMKTWWTCVEFTKCWTVRLTPLYLKCCLQQRCRWGSLAQVGWTGWKPDLVQKHLKDWRYHEFFFYVFMVLIWPFDAIWVFESHNKSFPELSLALVHHSKPPRTTFEQSSGTITVECHFECRKSIKIHENPAYIFWKYNDKVFLGLQELEDQLSWITATEPLTQSYMCTHVYTYCTRRNYLFASCERYILRYTVNYKLYNMNLYLPCFTEGTACHKIALWQNTQRLFFKKWCFGHVKHANMRGVLWVQHGSNK